MSSPDKRPWLVERVTRSRFLRDANIGQEITAALRAVDQAMDRQSVFEMYVTGSAMSVAAALGLYLQYAVDQAWWGGGSWWSVARPFGLVIGSVGLISIIIALERARLQVKSTVGAATDKRAAARAQRPADDLIGPAPASRAT
ncbi:hypothetical protein ACIBHX_23115 [Nonomuraea sp. NPDC050536]|uniref:hypothetical protein n=1 Tax=Nonomuraea sp. NPDC050536 TaxID=3364366 RepID=UPI0037C617C5